MDIRNLNPQELEHEQVENIIAAAVDKANSMIDELVDIDEEDLSTHATFELAAQSSALHMMQIAMELASEFNTVNTLCTLEVFKVAMENKEDEEKFKELVKPASWMQHKYSVLNNDILSILLFELSKDILTEDEFIEVLM